MELITRRIRPSTTRFLFFATYTKCVMLGDVPLVVLIAAQTPNSKDDYYKDAPVNAGPL